MLQSPRRAPTRSLVTFLLSVVLAATLSSTAAQAAHHRRHAGPTQRALRAAAASARRADRRLVIRARMLNRCIRRTSGRTGTCRSLHAAVQRAGRSSAAAQSRLSRLARRSARAHRASSGWSTPKLSADGYKLSWNAIPYAGSYVLVSEVPGQGNRYSVVSGTSVSPPPVPGVQVTYMVRTAWRWSSWSNAVTISYPTAPPAPTPTPPAGPPAEELDKLAAPALKVSGEALSWNLVAGVNTYVLVTKVPGKAESFTTVSGTSVTPPAVPGKTVHYSVRTAVQGSAWAPEVAISYPSKPVESAPAPPPVEGTPAPGTVFGVDSGFGELDFHADQILRPPVVRMEFGLGEHEIAQHVLATAQRLAGYGSKLEPLVTFDGRIPTTAEAISLGEVAKVAGSYIKAIEFGNETSFSYQYGDNYSTASYKERARRYALLVREAAQATRPYGVGILAQADDGGSGSAVWVNEMFASVPNLSSYVTGWTIHPYDNASSVTAADTYGIPKMRRMVADLAAVGDTTTPVYVTEDGIASDNGPLLNNGVHMTYAEAATSITHQVAELRTAAGSHGIATFIFYTNRDQREPGVGTEHEWYFGVLGSSDQAKGAYTTAIQALL